MRYLNTVYVRAHRARVQCRRGSLLIASPEGSQRVPLETVDAVVVMGSAQLLHAAHGNRSNRRRTNITLWYYPAYAAMPESIQAFVAQEGWPDDWYQANRDRLEPLRPVYTGPARPIRHNRNPGAALK